MTELKKNVVEKNSNGTYSGYFEGNNVRTGTFDECYSACLNLKRDKIRERLSLRIKEPLADGIFIVCAGDHQLKEHTGTYEECQTIINGLINAHLSPFDFISDER